VSPYLDGRWVGHAGEFLIGLAEELGRRQRLSPVPSSRALGQPSFRLCLPRPTLFFHHRQCPNFSSITFDYITPLSLFLARLFVLPHLPVLCTISLSLTPPTFRLIPPRLLPHSTLADIAVKYMERLFRWFSSCGLYIIYFWVIYTCSSFHLFLVTYC